MNKYWYMNHLINRCKSTWCSGRGEYQVYDHNDNKVGKFCFGCADRLVQKKTAQLQTGHNRRSTD